MVLSPPYLGNPHSDWHLTQSNHSCRASRAINYETGQSGWRRESTWAGEVVMPQPAEEFLSFGRKISLLPVTGKQLILSSGEKWPFTKIEGRENRRSRKDAPAVISFEYFLGGLLFLKLVLSSCYFCETPLLLYTNQCVMDSRAGNWCAVGMQCAREIIGILFHGRKSIMKPINMSQF